MDDSTSYTLATMAPLVAMSRNAREVYATSRKIQNWVTAGLVRPIGKRHSGRGKHRRYDGYELEKVAVLIELSRYQVPTVVLEVAARLFDDLREKDEVSDLLPKRPGVPGAAQSLSQMRTIYRAAKAGKKGVYLLLGAGPDDQVVGGFGKRAQVPEGLASAVVVNISEVFSRLR